ncbi:MAG: hypothetical protein HFJ33_01650 [Clostridia bacterium]|nr:hypothetical protein [Clostridia bacterium]
MADLGEVNNVSGVFGGVELGNMGNDEQAIQENAGTIRQAGNGNNLPAKAGLWNKFKAFWLQDIDWNKEIKVELTPYQQKVEDEINEFLHQEITWEKVHDFLFQEVSFRSKN